VHKLVLIRHGESLWNRENRFTGWVDVDLSEKGMLEAQSAGELLRKEGFTFDCAYTSVLKRAIRTLWVVLDELDLMWVPVTRSWRLNERHYGALAGLNKSETAAKYGEDQVFIWRRSYDVRPPQIDVGNKENPAYERRYAELTEEQIPRGECLQDTVARAVPFWDSEIAPAIKSGKKVVIVAHGNSIRALVKHLDKLPDDVITGLNIPTGIPLVYELDDDLVPIRHYYLGDQDAVAAAVNAVASQGKAEK